MNLMPGRVVRKEYMADVQISLNNIRNTKTVFIEGVGVFTVRKLGAGEELDLTEKMRKLGAILEELQSINFSRLDSSKKKDLAELKKIQKRVDSLSEEVSEIQRFELDTYKKCFTDDNNGENVNLLLNTLSVEERSELFKQIFPPLRQIEEPEIVPVVTEKPKAKKSKAKGK